MRLEGFFSRLNKQNMKRRLYDIYKWQVGRSDANRSDYANWLSGVADWIQTQSEEEGKKDKEAPGEKAKTKAEKLKKTTEEKPVEEAEQAGEKEAKTGNEK